MLLTAIQAGSEAGNQPAAVAPIQHQEALFILLLLKII